MIAMQHNANVSAWNFADFDPFKWFHKFVISFHRSHGCISFRLISLVYLDNLQLAITLAAPKIFSFDIRCHSFTMTAHEFGGACYTWNENSGQLISNENWHLLINKVLIDVIWAWYFLRFARCLLLFFEFHLFFFCFLDSNADTVFFLFRFTNTSLRQLSKFFKK